MIDRRVGRNYFMELMGTQLWKSDLDQIQTSVIRPFTE